MKDKTCNISGKFMYVVDTIPENEFMDERLITQEVYIEKVLYNNPVTVVIWSDGTKTISKCHNNDIYSKETGLAICILKKVVGTQHVRSLFSEWLPWDNENIVTLSDVRYIQKHGVPKKLYNK